MDATNLKLLLLAHRLSQSDLARIAGVTRQTVSRWFSVSRKSASGAINIESKTLLSLTRALGVSAEAILDPVHVPEKQEYTAALLWDRLYGSLEEFAVALARQELKALARLAQVFGMFAAAKVAGPAVWNRFEKYSKYIHPTRRIECEKIWALQKNLA